MTVLCTIAAVVLLAFSGLYLWQQSRVYRAVFTDAHVREFVGVVQRLREPALALGGAVPKDLSDKRVATTSAGIHVAYTAMPHGDSAVEHHVSVSLLGGYTAAAVGHAFVRLAMEVLGFDAEQYVVGRSQRGVWHGAVQLDAEAHATLAQRALPALDEGQIAKLFTRAQERARDPRAVQALSVR
jgi:hypothetical protein